MKCIDMDQTCDKTQDCDNGFDEAIGCKYETDKPGTTTLEPPGTDEPSVKPSTLYPPTGKIFFVD